MKSGQLAGAKVKKFISPIGEAESFISGYDMETINRDEVAVKCAKALYAGAVKGVFTGEESVNCLRDSVQALEAVLNGRSQAKKKAQRILTSILKFLDENQRGGSVEICFFVPRQHPPRNGNGWRGPSNIGFLKQQSGKEYPV